ncbi:uncharacterized protein LOC115631409 [Scaptodrosophila lebanonensis]|uniref:Uncharacterized protein LOC115631409 n=1 Tax=Drosophila lebanonensis TaxID=7225 RepID=A0A6J2U9X0_DROLE|nr:uncharacterized protein LOC115631409 [Scaptodrosophila lebanonensis]
MAWKWMLFFACALSICGSRSIEVAAARQRRVRHIASRTPTATSAPVSGFNGTEFVLGLGLGPEFAIVRRVYEGCLDKNNFVGCLKHKALLALSRALNQDSIKITDGLVLEKQNQTDRERVVSVLTEARNIDNLDRVLLTKLEKLMRTHSLKIDLDVGVGRGHDDKKKKHKEGGGHMKYVIAALLTAMGIAGPLGLKALAAIAGKALVISKVALTIAGIIALKKLFSHDHSEESSFQVHANDHNRRNTYVIRPVSKANAGVGVSTAVGGSSSSLDPYRYYYEYHQ